MELILLIVAGVIVILLGAALVVISNQARIHKLKFHSITKDKSNYESIIDQANDAMFVIDIVDGKIHQTNPSAATLLGYSQLELLQLSLFELHPKEFLEKSSQVVADVWEKGGLIYKDLPFVTKQGEQLPVECSAKVAPFAGRPAIVIYARDIRERLKMEKEIQDQKEIIEQKNKDITDSIEYAKNIQEAILSNREKLAEEGVSDAFILFMPKDIVSGDFYWYRKQGDHLLFAAADCTGHGVPGALMSMIGNSALNEVVVNNQVVSAGKILGKIRKVVIKTLKQADTANDRKDGMDIALCSLNTKTLGLEYAGAFNNLWMIRKGIADSDLAKMDRTSLYGTDLLEVKADKFPIGTYVGREGEHFFNNSFQTKKGDCLYVFTDGYADQFGGPKGKKFKYKQLMDMLIDMHEKPMKEQKEMLRAAFHQWRGHLEQVDDVLIIGVRI